MELNPFDRGRSDRQLRVIEPVNFEQSEDACFVLGSDEPGWWENLDVGDGIGVYRSDIDCTGVNFIRARFRTRGPIEDLLSGDAWKLSILINDVVHASKWIDSSRTEDLYDMGVNVSKLTGAQKVEFRLELLTP